jgi:hypothetical protein
VRERAVVHSHPGVVLGGLGENGGQSAH